MKMFIDSVCNSGDADLEDEVLEGVDMLDVIDSELFLSRIY